MCIHSILQSHFYQLLIAVFKRIRLVGHQSSFFPCLSLYHFHIENNNIHFINLSLSNHTAKPVYYCKLQVKEWFGLVSLVSCEKTTNLVEQSLTLSLEGSLHSCLVTLFLNVPQLIHLITSYFV